MQFQFNDGGRLAAGYTDKAGDCVCRAISIASGLPYQQVYEALANGNAAQSITKKTKRSKKSMKKAKVKTACRGITTSRKWFSDYMESIGFVWVPTMFIGQGCKVHLKADELPSGQLIVSVSKHMTAVIDGVLNDTYDCSRNETRCVYGYYYRPPEYQGTMYY